jgi:hypothetical protein
MALDLAFTTGFVVFSRFEYIVRDDFKLGDSDCPFSFAAHLWVK